MVDIILILKTSPNNLSVLINENIMASSNLDTKLYQYINNYAQNKIFKFPDSNIKNNQEKIFLHPKNVIEELTLIHNTDNPIDISKFDLPIFYINMDKSTDRREFMEKQFKNFKVPITRNTRGRNF